jgi:hypothetical protein
MEEGNAILVEDVHEGIPLTAWFKCFNCNSILAMFHFKNESCSFEFGTTIFCKCGNLNNIYKNFTYGGQYLNDAM